MTLFHQALQEDLKQAHRLAEMYREQCITLETELSQIREEGDVGREIFKVPLLYWCLCLYNHHTRVCILWQSPVLLSLLFWTQ